MNDFIHTRTYTHVHTHEHTHTRPRIRIHNVMHTFYADALITRVSMFIAVSNSLTIRILLITMYKFRYVFMCAICIKCYNMHNIINKFRQIVHLFIGIEKMATALVRNFHTMILAST